MVVKKCGKKATGGWRKDMEEVKHRPLRDSNWKGLSISGMEGKEASPEEYLEEANTCSVLESCPTQTIEDSLPQSREKSCSREG
jgi:hypothetical protein